MALPKVVLVTGGGSGIGRATCEKFCTEGYCVAVADTNVAAAEETVSLLKQTRSDVRAIVVQVDVTKEQDVQNMIKGNSNISSAALLVFYSTVSYYPGSS